MQLPDIIIENEVGKVLSNGDRTHTGWYITATRSDTGPFSVFFDTEGYLLNDSGKTIEVLR